MKKITQLVLVALTVLSIGVVPVAVSAQDADPIVVGEETPTTTTLPETGAAGVPDTGIAPNSKVAQNTAVFIGGSAIGAGVGFGIVTLRKKRLNQ